MSWKSLHRMSRNNVEAGARRQRNPYLAMDAGVGQKQRAYFEAERRRDYWWQQPFLAEKPTKGCRRNNRAEFGPGWGETHTGLDDGRKLRCSVLATAADAASACVSYGPLSGNVKFVCGNAVRSAAFRAEVRFPVACWRPGSTLRGGSRRQLSGKNALSGRMSSRRRTLNVRKWRRTARPGSSGARAAMSAWVGFRTTARQVGFAAMKLIERPTGWARTATNCWQ